MYNDFKHLLFGGKVYKIYKTLQQIDSKHLNIRRSVPTINLTKRLDSNSTFFFSFFCLIILLRDPDPSRKGRTNQNGAMRCRGQSKAAPSTLHSAGGAAEAPSQAWGGWQRGRVGPNPMWGTPCSPPTTGEESSLSPSQPRPRPHTASINESSLPIAGSFSWE